VLTLAVASLVFRFVERARDPFSDTACFAY